MAAAEGQASAVVEDERAACGWGVSEGRTMTEKGG